MHHDDRDDLPHASSEALASQPVRLSTARRGSLLGRVLGVLLAGTVWTGCAASNYDFDALNELRATPRGSHLTRGLEREREEGEAQELFALDVVPLARTRLNVFAASKDEGIPAGYVEADVDAYLPLFGIVDATIQRYDEDSRWYERHDVRSYLWGLWQSHKEQIDTQNGVRERTKRRFLWFFGWSSRPRYVPPVGDVPLE